MSPSAAHVVILGAGHAGGTAAALLRQYGHGGAITLIGEEPIPPYQRPPLSKTWLKGEADAESVTLRPLEFYAEQGIDFLASTRAVILDRDAKRLILDNGATVAYDILIIATGARAATLKIPGADLSGVLALRTAADADQLKAVIGQGTRLIVIGGGYIGLEVAASARGLGADVTVLEREPRLLARVAYHALSDFFRRYHESHGVKFHLDCAAEAFQGEGGRLTGVAVNGGRVLPCDAVVVGVGAAPNEEIAAHSGLDCMGGIVVDIEARTSDPDIFAIGDVTRRPMPIYGRSARLESVPNALEQAKQAACAITGRPAPAGETPWQWSDQYDLKLQIAGYPFDVDKTVLRGDPASGQFAVFHQVQAVEAINSPPDFMVGRQLIGNRKAVDTAKLADSAVSLREVAA